MADATLRSLRFRTEREESWKNLEALLKRAEGSSGKSLTDAEMLAIPALYRAALSSLSVARATSLDSALVDYLEALCARAYFFVYGARSTLQERVWRFFARDWPGVVQSLWRETLVSTLLLVAGAVTAYLLVRAEPDWYFAFLSPDMAQGRDPNATTESLRQTLYTDLSAKDELATFATFLFTHNAQVALMAFALGFAFCLPTAMLIAYTGFTLGAMFALFDAHGLAPNLAGWIFIHGVTELFAIILAGAAGMRIGWSVAFPGARTRLGAAAQAGRDGGVVMVGVVVMLFVAGTLEGFARQLIQVDWMRYAIAISTLVIWCSYFYLGPRKRESPNG